jgi:hypothetical protein
MAGGVVDLIDVVPAVEAAAGIVGSDIAIGDEVIWVQAHQPVGGLERIGPVILSGREPRRANEIALGTISMRDLGVGIGDSVTVKPTVTGGNPLRMTVVGSVLVNDAAEKSPGRGGVVTLDWMTSNNPEASASPLVLRLQHDTHPAAVADALERDHQVVVVPPVPHEAILNVERVRGVPLLLAAVIATLAGVSLAHALATSIRRSRRQLAMWRTLGFTSAQVRSAIALHASSLALVAVLAGVPLGLLAGRVGWRVVADTLGVGTMRSTPPPPPSSSPLERSSSSTSPSPIGLARVARASGASDPRRMTSPPSTTRNGQRRLISAAHRVL